MAVWMKMSLGMELGIGPGDFMLDGEPAPLPKNGVDPPPKKSAHVYSGKNGWMDEAGTWRGGRPQPRRLCVRWGPSPLPQVFCVQ